MRRAHDDRRQLGEHAPVLQAAEVGLGVHLDPHVEGDVRIVHLLEDPRGPRRPTSVCSLQRCRDLLFVTAERVGVDHPPDRCLVVDGADERPDEVGAVGPVDAQLDAERHADLVHGGAVDRLGEVGAVDDLPVVLVQAPTVALDPQRRLAVVVAPEGLRVQEREVRGVEEVVGEDRRR